MHTRNTYTKLILNEISQLSIWSDDESSRTSIYHSFLFAPVPFHRLLTYTHTHTHTANIHTYIQTYIPHHRHTCMHSCVQAHTRTRTQHIHWIQDLVPWWIAQNLYLPFVLNCTSAFSYTANTHACARTHTRAGRYIRIRRDTMEHRRQPYAEKRSIVVAAELLLTSGRRSAPWGARKRRWSIHLSIHPPTSTLTRRLSLNLSIDLRVSLKISAPSELCIQPKQSTGITHRDNGPGGGAAGPYAMREAKF